MLRRNVNTNAGLVNGAIGTVVAIRPDCISDKFDHINKPYHVKRVEQIHSHEEFLRLLKAVSADFGLHCNHSQLSGPVTRPL